MTYQPKSSALMLCLSLVGCCTPQPASILCPRNAPISYGELKFDHEADRRVQELLLELLSLEADLLRGKDAARDRGQEIVSVLTRAANETERHRTCGHLLMALSESPVPLLAESYLLGCWAELAEDGGRVDLRDQAWRICKVLDKAAVAERWFQSTDLGRYYCCAVMETFERAAPVFASKRPAMDSAAFWKIYSDWRTDAVRYVAALRHVK